MKCKAANRTFTDFIYSEVNPFLVFIAEMSSRENKVGGWW